MKKTITLLMTLLIMIIGMSLTGCSKQDSSVEKTFNKLVLGQETIDSSSIKPKSVSQTAIFLIADNTGSMRKYSIPKISVDIVSSLIDKIYESGGGYLYLSSFDSNIRNNSNLYLSIPCSISKTAKPERKSGETFYEYEKKIKIWENENQNYSSDSSTLIVKFETDKKDYLQKCSQFLDDVYSQTTSETKATDVFGMVNAAINSFNNLPGSSIRKIIVGYTDYEETVKRANRDSFTIPSDVKIYEVNPIPGTTKTKISNKIIEVIPDRLLNNLFSEGRN